MFHLNGHCIENCCQDTHSSKSNEGAIIQSLQEKEVHVQIACTQGLYDPTQDACHYSEIQLFSIQSNMFETENREAKMKAKFVFPDKKKMVIFYFNPLSHRNINNAHLFAQTVRLAFKPVNCMKDNIIYKVGNICQKRGLKDIWLCQTL